KKPIGELTPTGRHLENRAYDDQLDPKVLPAQRPLDLLGLTLCTPAAPSRASTTLSCRFDA
ncbi:MAG: hypothetical protein ACLP9L_42435, partial [Thermoguttaceae bacterium]